MQRPVTKILIITHDAGNYGASRSLQLLVNSWNGVIIDMIVARRFIGRFRLRDIRRRFHANVARIMKMHLPLDYCYRGKPDRPVVLRIYRALLRLLWLAEKRRFQRILRSGGYDLIHINSLVLHGLITDTAPCTIHVREIYDGSSEQAVASLRKARGIVFIDEATRQPFAATAIPPSIVLNNPIDMTPLAASPSVASAGRGLDPGAHTIFAMIGKITSDKGADFVIRCFRDVRADDARLLIVGAGDPAAIARARKTAADDRRIVFWGEEPDILKIYRISDYILRGEPYPCIGRTVYEGLFAGAGVIIPATRESINDLFDRDRFADRIHTYSPRNEAELRATMQALSGSKIVNRVYQSNVAEYVTEFEAFARYVLSGRQDVQWQQRAP